MRAEQVIDALYNLFLKHGKPEYLRSNNGPEFIAEKLKICLKKQKSKPFISIPDHYGRMAITNNSMEPCAMKSSMPSGFQQHNRPESSSTNGSNNTTTSDCIRHST